MKAEPEVQDRASINHSGHAYKSNQLSHQSIKRHAANVALIVIAIVALFWRVFFLGETLIDVATLNNQLPWGYHAGQSDYPYNRRDLTDTYVTRDYFVAAAYRDGEFPLWNPYTMAGHPIYADGVTRTLSPFLVFYKFFDVPLGYTLARIGELMLAGVFIYLFLIGIGASGNGALMGSLVFAFSSHSMLHLTGLGWWGGLMWLPLVFLFADRAINRRSYVQAVLAGVCLAAQFFCGYLPNQIYYVGAIVLYYLFFASRNREQGRRIASSLTMMAATLATGLVLAATQWVPALELLSHSNRKIVGAELGYVYLPPWYGATLIFPNLFGAAYDAKTLTLFTALGVSHDHILYLGIAALLPAGFAVLWLRSARVKRASEAKTRGNPGGADGRVARPGRDKLMFFAFLAMFSLAIMMAAPLYVPVTRFIPVLQVIRVAVRAGVLFLFAAAVLVAFGTDLLLESSADLVRRFARLAKRFSIAAAAFVAAAVIGAYLIKLSGLAVGPEERGRLAFIRKAALALSEQFTPPDLSILFSLGLVVLFAVLLWAFAERRLPGRSTIMCLIGLLIVDLFWNSTQFNHTFDRSQVFPKTEITDLLQSLPAGRVLVVPSDLETNRRVSSESKEKIIAPPNTLLTYQVSTVSGKNQQFPRWYREYASLVEPQNNLSHVVFDQYRSRYLDLLNAKYVMTYDDARLLGEYRLLIRAEGVSLYENMNAMPRAFFVSQTVEVQSHTAAIKALGDSGFNPRSTAIIEVSGAPESERQEFAKGSADRSQMMTLMREKELPQSPAIATITEDKRNRVVIQTDSGADGLLVLSDNYYPGWRASVDDAPAQVFRANCTMRAVNVPAGRHVVSFAFVPATFFTSVYISLAAAALTLAFLIYAALKRRRSDSHVIR
ncbi:MAG TPA: YfhO family protein [Blastocatellia bacterium]|nr:YfhO family protein [Blastocatellia bacterium]